MIVSRLGKWPEQLAARDLEKMRGDDEPDCKKSFGRRWGWLRGERAGPLIIRTRICC